MSVHIAELVNSIPGIEGMSLLELGTYAGKNFEKFKAYLKHSVDIDHKPTFNMTTDEFFESEIGPYGIIFIDADHRVDQVVRDFNNSIRFCHKVLFVHDLFPNSEDQACDDGNWAGDGYKMLAWMYANNYEFYTLNCDSGLTMVFPPFKIVSKDIRITNYKQFLDAVKNMERYSLGQMKQILRMKLS